MRKLKYYILGMMIIFVAATSFTLMDGKVEGKDVSTNENNLKIEIIHGDIPEYSSFAQLYEMSDLIVQGKITGNRSGKFIQAGEDSIQIGTLTDFKVSKVHKGEKLENNVITVVEAAYIRDQTLYSLEGNTLLADNDKYILFLGKNTDGSYHIVGTFQGKYNLEKNKEPNNIKLDNSEYIGEEKEHYRFLNKVVLENIDVTE